MGKKWKQWQILFSWAPKSLQIVTAATKLKLKLSHKIKRLFLLGRKAMTNLDSLLKSRDITLLTKVRIVKAMNFPVVMYGYDSWTIRKAEWVIVTQLYLSLCDSMNCSQPGSIAHGILQARILEWIAISFSKRNLSTKELMLLNCGIGEDSSESVGLQGNQTSQS